jgi:uncharacterized protein
LLTNYPQIETEILHKLEAELPANLYYHGLHHTLDVLNAAVFYGNACELSEKELFLLKVATLYHDSGFTEQYAEHEVAGCLLARKMLPKYDIDEENLELICGMIMATKIPQSPTNLLEEIICDADIDYLGRDDFYPIADSLFRELKARDLVNNLDRWNNIQVDFIGNHHYFTNAAIELRTESKLRHLEELKELLPGRER